MPTYTQFKHTLEVGLCDFTNALAHNLCSWVDWAFLEIGAFYSVPLTQSGYYGGLYSKLRPVNDPYYTSGQIWEAFRGNWVYESGLEYRYQPVNVSGVWVNGTFHPTTGIGTYAHNINYPMGQVVFNNPVGLFNSVKCEYSYKYVNVSTTDNLWARNIITDSMRGPDNPQFNIYDSGIFTYLAKSRVNLPAVIIDPLAQVRFQGLELGGGVIRNQDVLFYVLAETPQERNNIVDKLLYQQNKTIFFYDINALAQSGKFPLTMEGYKNPSGLQYPQMVDEFLGYRQRRCVLTNPVALGADNDRNLYRCIIKFTCEIQVPEA